MITPIYASSDVNLENFPAGLASQLGITEFAGGILATIILCAIFLFPVALFTRNFLPSFIIGLIVIGFGVSVGWLPSWVMIMITLIIAGLYAGKMRDAMG